MAEFTCKYCKNIFDWKKVYLLDRLGRNCAECGAEIDEWSLEQQRDYQSRKNRREVERNQIVAVSIVVIIIALIIWLI